jgi:hypothetical protein
MKRGLRKGDIILSILFVILLAVWLYIRSAGVGSDELSADIIQDGKVIRSLRLRPGMPPQEFTIERDGGWNKIRVEGEKIAVVDANCPDKYCVRRGWLKEPGSSAVCAPHRLEIRISGKSRVDGVTY